MGKETVRFSAIGLNHGHIYGQVNAMLSANAELVSFYAEEPELVAKFSQTYPQAELAESVQQILEDETIDLVVSAAIPAERAPLGLDVMQHGTGYIRIDWYTPDGLSTWGDGRLLILGTQGYIELRKYCDIAGRPGGHHLFLVDREDVRYIDCSDVPLPYGRQLAYDIVHRTETAMSQAHCFLASELALRAEAQAARLGHLA